MPTKNRVKMYLPDTYYHAYNRGVEKRQIFMDDDDYRAFLHLLKRYLSGDKIVDASRHEFEDLSKSVELNAYCLLPNHFHLLLYQYEPNGITKLIRRVSTSYSMYFNKKYERVGSLFQGRYLANNIDNEAYLLHISRYIHLNSLDVGKSAEDYEFSSYQYFTGRKSAPWIKPDRILDFHKGHSYRNFVKDYSDHKKILNQIKVELADTKFS